MENPVITREQIESELPPVAGRQIVHRLTNAEQSQYITICNLEAEMESIRDLLTSAMGQTISDRIQQAMVQGYTEAGEATIFDPTEASEFLKAKAHFDTAKANFWLNIRQGRNSWNSWLSVAAGFVVVSDGPKLRIQ